MVSPAVGGRAGTPIGRDAELQVIDAFLDRAATGPSALVVSGPAGIGKSTVWRAAIAAARERGFRSLVTRAVEAECELAFAGLADLLDPALDDVAAQLPEPQRRALEVALQRAPEQAAAPPPLAISLGAATAIRALAEERPVLIAVDDLPWLDRPSARVLDFLVRRVADLPVGFLPAVRTTNDAPQPPAIAFSGVVDQLEIGPLGIDGIDALLRRDLDLALRRPDLGWVHRESRGNPFFALELGRALQRTGETPGLETPTFATGSDALVRSRLAGLPEDARLPLAAIAALSQPTIDLVLAVFQNAGPALDAAAAGRVLEADDSRLRFSHPLLASGAYGRLDEDERRLLHEQLGRVVRDPEQRARHLALAAVAPDPIVAVELDTAAEHARGRGAPDAAGELELMAIRLTGSWESAELQRRVLAAAGAFIQAGDPDRARVILEEHIERVGPGPERADALRVLADVRSSDDWEAKLTLLDRAIGEAGPNPGLRSSILADRSQVLFFLLRSAPESLANARAAVAEARGQDDPAILGPALMNTLFARLNVGDDIDTELRSEAMALADGVKHLRVFQWPAYATALVDITLDQLDSADRTLGTLRLGATERGDHDSLPLIATAQADVAFRLGRWPEALAHARDAERGSRQSGQLAGLTWSLPVRGMIESRLGGGAEVEVLLRENLELAESIRATFRVAEAHIAIGLHALELGKAAVAERELRLAAQPMLREGYVGPFRYRVLADWAESLTATGQPADALALIADHESDLRRLDRPSWLAAALRAKALAAAAVGDAAAADTAFQEALALHVLVPSPFPRAQTLLAYGEALRRARQRGRAREALLEAAAIFAALPAPRWLARANAELERTGHRAPGARLSATEQQVADLVAAGRTNREVAETLFMSPHTVEAHLTRVYRSLGVRSRTELAAALHERSHTDDNEPSERE